MADDNMDSGETVSNVVVMKRTWAGEVPNVSLLVAQSSIIPISQVINGDHPGRSSDDEITLFDGIGVGLQDLAVASVAARLEKEQSAGWVVDL